MIKNRHSVAGYKTLKSSCLFRENATKTLYYSTTLTESTLMNRS